MAGYFNEAGLRRIAALSPEEEAEELAYETSPEVQDQFISAIRAERDPAKRAVLERSYRNDFGNSPGEAPASPPSRHDPFSGVLKTGGGVRSRTGEFDPFRGVLGKAPSTPEPQSQGGFTGRMKDTAVDLATGVVGLGESIVGLGDIATFGLAGKALDTIGYDPKQTKEWLTGFQSEARQQEELDIHAADGFWDTLMAIGARPGALVGRIVQSAPGTLGAGAAGGAVARRIAVGAAAEAKAAGLIGEAAEAHIAQRVIEQTGKIVATAAGTEGAQAAGSIAEAGRQAGSEWSTYAPAALAGGAGTAAIGYGSGRLAASAIGKRLGLGDIETDIAMRGAGSTAAQSAASFARRVPMEAAKEGVIEEMPQSAQEHAFQNIATGETWSDGIDKAAAEGLIIGAGMGGAHAAVSGRAPSVPGETIGGKPLADFSTENLFSLRTSPVVSESARAKIEGELRRRETVDQPAPNDVDFNFQNGAAGAPESTDAMAAQLSTQNARRQEQMDAAGFAEQQTAAAARNQAVIDVMPEIGRDIPASRLLPAPSGADFVASETAIGTQSQWHNAVRDDAEVQRKQGIASGLLAHHPRPSPDLLTRLMRVDQTMAAMLFNQWEAGKNGALATVEQGNSEMAAPGVEGPRDFIPGSASVLASSPVGDVAAVGAGAEVAASGLRPYLPAGAEGAPGVTAQDIEAHAAATSPFNGTPQPTEAQKQAGNYKVGRLRFQGLDISIENPAGSMRSGTDADGRAWQTEMQHHYGYIKGTVGKDKDHLDVFIKPNAKTAGTAYVIDQADPKTGKFDEHKIVFGADSEADATAIYQSNYEEGWQGLGAITAMPMADFKAWIKGGKTKKPLAYVEPKEVRTATRRRPASDTLIQAVINRGGINRSIMQDVGADPAGKYQPGLFTKTGTTDLSSLADYLFNEEELLSRAVGGERILRSSAMEREYLAELTAAQRAEIVRLANEYGVALKDGTRKRPEEDIENDLIDAIAFEVGTAGEGYSSIRNTALEGGITESDLDAVETPIADSYHGDKRRDADVLMYRDLANAIQEAIDGRLQREESSGEGENAGDAEAQAGGARAEERPAFDLEGQTEDGLAEQDQQRQAVEAQRLKDEQAAENKRQADGARNTFILTGSDRPADVLAAQGQDGLFDAAPANNADSDATLARTRDRSEVRFQTPYVGTTGAQLVGYVWPNKKEEYIDKRGEDRVRTVSDWERAVDNLETGRQIVHQFAVRATDGTEQDVSAETAAKLLGISESAVRSSAKRMLEKEIARAKKDATETVEADKVDAISATSTPAEAVENLATTYSTNAAMVIRMADRGPRWSQMEGRIEREAARAEKYRFLVRDGLYVWSPDMAPEGSELYRRGWRTEELRASEIWPVPATIAGKPVAEMSDGMLGQIAKSSQPAAVKAKAEVSRRAKDKRPQWAKDANVSVGDVFDFSMPSDYATGRMIVEHIDNASASVKDIEPPGNGTVLTGIQLRRAITDGKAVRVERDADAVETPPGADGALESRGTASHQAVQAKQETAGDAGVGAITDFGAKIEGARKDYAAKLKEARDVKGVSLESRRAPSAPLPDAIVANPLTETKDADHSLAKAGSEAASMRLAKKLVTPDLVEQLRGVAADKPLIVGVSSIEATGKNALPRAGAEVLAHRLGLETAPGIVQSSMPKRTGMDGLGRIFSRPEFAGDVEPGRGYILLDDTLTQGGTFAAMAAHIEAGGGHVVAIVALTGKQYSAKLSPSAETIQQVRDKFGDIENDFRQATGYGFDGLTESEGRYLARFDAPDAIRDRIAAEALDRPVGPVQSDAASRDSLDDKTPPSGGVSASGESRAVGQGSPSDEIPSVRAIRDVVEKFKAQFKGAEALDIRVVPTAYDIPERYRKSPFAEGVFHDGSGTIWLVTMNLRGADGKLDTGRAFQVLLHEAVGHYGLASMMGAKFAGIRDKVLAAAKAKGEVFKETEDRKYKPGDADYATVEAVRQRYPNETDEEIAQEVLARMAETDPGRTLFGYVRAVVRQWFRDMARAFGRNIEVTTKELNDLVALASAYMRRGDNLAGDYQPSGLVAASNSAGLESRSGPAAAPIWSAPETSRVDDLIYSLQDKNIDLKRVQEGIKQAVGNIRDDIDTYLQEELFHGRAAKATDEFLDRELQPFIGEMKARGIDMDGLETYLWARHAAERNAQIAKINPDMPEGGSGLTDRQAADLMAGKDVTVGGKAIKGLPPAKARSYADLAKRVDAMVSGNRMLLELYELETPETVAAWQSAYQHYVPLHREDAETPWAGPGTGMGYSVRGSSVKRATGSFRPVENILANLVLQRTRTITRGEKNRVAQALYGLAKAVPNADFWTTDDAPTVRVVENKAIYHVMDGKTEVANFTSMGEAEKKARENRAWFVYQDWGDRVVERPDPSFRSKPNVVWSRFNGEDRFVIFNERDERAARMAAALKNLDADDISNALGEVARWTRYFASINTQYNPVFGIINLVRDTGTSVLNLSSTPLAGKQAELLGHVYQALPAIYKAVRTDRQGGTPTGTWAQLWEEFQEVGGQTGYRDMFRNSHEQREALEKALDPKWWQDKWWGKALTLGGALSVPEQFLSEKIGKPVFEWLSDYNTTMENGIRLSAYKLGLDQGMTKARAASLAKNLTVNFNKKGQIARQAGAWYAFFNASVQGTARMAETLHAGAKPGELLGKAGKQIVYGGMLLGAVQAMLLMMAGFDDDEPPEFVRDRNIIIPIGDKKYLTVAMPLGFHVLPAFGRIATEFVLGGFKGPGEHVVHLFDVLADSFNPIGNAGMSVQTLAPTVLDPFAALAENKDWAGKPIYREDFSKLAPTPGFSRTKDTATAFSKALAYALNRASGGTEFQQGMMSPTPDQIDYLIGQVTGGVGRELGKVEQTVRATITGSELPPYKIPLLGRFYGDANGQSAEGGRFYDNLKAMNEHQAELKGLWDSNRSAQASAYAKEHPEALMFREADRMQRYVALLRKEKAGLESSGSQRDKIKATDELITKTMREFNQRVEAAKKPKKAAERVN